MITILKIILFHDEILIKYYTFDVNCLLFSFLQTEETSGGVHKVPAFPEARQL